jgi:hypothetical protein
MRVRWPLPRALNHSTTSLSRRRCTLVLPLGMTTRADFPLSEPRPGALGVICGHDVSLLLGKHAQ